MPEDGMQCLIVACGYVKGAEEFWKLGDQKNAVETFARDLRLLRNIVASDIEQSRKQAMR